MISCSDGSGPRRCARAGIATTAAATSATAATTLDRRPFRKPDCIVANAPRPWSLQTDVRCPPPSAVLATALARTHVGNGLRRDRLRGQKVAAHGNPLPGLNDGRLAREHLRRVDEDRVETLT